MKKGFTLVELLAVIAILAILVIIALPNVMGMFNQAKKNSFTTEIKEIYKVAQQTWMSESMFNTSDKVYSRCSGCTNPLDLSGREELEYYIKIDKSGKVVKFFATDNTYQYSFDNNSGLKIEDIKDVDQVTDVIPSNVLHITSDGAELGDVTYLYFSDYMTFNVGDSAPSTSNEHIFNNYQAAINDMGYNFFIRLKVSNDIITQTDLGYVIDNRVYYIDGALSHDDMVNILLGSFDSQYCEREANHSYCYISAHDGIKGLYVGVSYGHPGAYDNWGGNSTWSCQVESWGAQCIQPD